MYLELYNFKLLLNFWPYKRQFEYQFHDKGIRFLYAYSIKNGDDKVGQDYGKVEGNKFLKSIEIMNPWEEI